jgi:hypothetical protein
MSRIANPSRRQPKVRDKRQNRIALCVHLVGLDPAISHPHQIANDAIRVSNHPMKMTGTGPSALVMVGLDPAISHPHQFANDAIPVRNHPDRDGPVKPDPYRDWRRVRYVNIKGGWYKFLKYNALFSSMHTNLVKSIYRQIV